MPPTVEDRLRDILEAITKIEAITRTCISSSSRPTGEGGLAAERLLEIICEASRSVPDNMKSSEPGIEWRKMIDFGNVLRHAYHMTKAEVVWDAIQTSLPALKAGVQTLMRRSGS